MRSDPTATRRVSVSGIESRFDVSLGVPEASDHDRRRLAAELSALELRLAIIDDRIERLATRPDREYRAWRADTVGHMQALAESAGRLQRAGALVPHQRDRVAAVLATVRHRLGVIERMRAAATARVDSLPAAPARGSMGA